MFRSAHKMTIAVAVLVTAALFSLPFEGSFAAPITNSRAKGATKGGGADHPRAYTLQPVIIGSEPANARVQVRKVLSVMQRDLAKATGGRQFRIDDIAKVPMTVSIGTKASEVRTVLEAGLQDLGDGSQNGSRRIVAFYFGKIATEHVVEGNGYMKSPGIAELDGRLAVISMDSANDMEASLRYQSPWISGSIANVALHETLHLLGALDQCHVGSGGHSTNPKDVMYPAGTLGERITLDADNSYWDLPSSSNCLDLGKSPFLRAPVKEQRLLDKGWDRYAEQLGTVLTGSYPTSSGWVIKGSNGTVTLAKGATRATVQLTNGNGTGVSTGSSSASSRASSRN